MRKLLQKVLPYSLKLQLKLLQRTLKDRNSTINFCNYYQSENIGNFEFELTQPIKEGTLNGNKIHNLKLVGEKINNLIIQPNEVFSFWKLIRKPTAKNNFRKGRNLINGTISEDFGGGICQFSSILYHLALQTGFQILERYPHSMDIYKEDERFTPLGADATVVYGYKDLQFQNTTSFTFQFKCEVSAQKIQLKLIAENRISLKKIKFNYSTAEGGVWVETKDDEQTIFKNFYIRL